MNFVEAYKAIKSGKKVRVKVWQPGEYIEWIDGGNAPWNCNIPASSSCIEGEDGDEYYLSEHDYLSEWELYEE